LRAFRYYATGDHYQTLATLFGITKWAVSEVVTRVTDALLRLASDYIRFPTNNELPAIKLGFQEVCFSVLKGIFN
jgi:hypothetical protein